MVKLLAFIFIFLFSFTSYAQCEKGWEKFDKKDKMAFYEKTFSAQTIDSLKKTTTIFFYQKADIPTLDTLRRMLTEAWDITPLIFVEGTKAAEYMGNPAYSYFVNSSYDVDMMVGGTSSNPGDPYAASNPGTYASWTHYYLLLQFGGKDATNLCRIELYPKFRTAKPKGQDYYDIDRNIFYSRILFHNWTPLLLKAQLQEAAANIKNKFRPCLYDIVKAENLTELLTGDTLYVPKSLLLDFNILNGNENYQGDDIFSGYKYKYRLCTDEELYDIFEVQKRGRLLFENVISSTFKYITIHDMRDKKIVYRNFVQDSKTIKAKDIKAIK